MPFCSNCGAPAEGKFCTRCGSPVSNDAAGGETRAALPLAANVASTLCYIPFIVFAILFLLWKPHNSDKTIRFHAWQAIFLQLGWLVVLVVISAVLPALSGSLAEVVERLINLGFILLVGFLMWKTYQKEKVVLPLVGELAEKQV